jgi:hypothetical protein
MRIGLSTLLVVSLVSGIAKAEERIGDRYRTRPLAVEAQFAPVGGPIGPAGIAADYALLPELSLSGGAGVGIAGVQLGAAVRPRIPVSQVVALELTAGYSHGDYTHYITLGAGGGGNLEKFTGASWINGDVGVQARFWSGVTLRFFVGVSKLVACNKAEHIYDGPETVIPRERWPWLSYGGVGIGYAFGATHRESE